MKPAGATMSYAAVAALLLAITSWPNNAEASPVLYCKDGPGIDLVNDGCISGESRSYPGGGDGAPSKPQFLEQPVQRSI